MAGAVYFASLKLKQGHYLCGGKGTGAFSLNLGKVPCYNSAGNIESNAPLEYAHHRAVWQIPVAIVIAALGFGAAVTVARSGRTRTAVV